MWKYLLENHINSECLIVNAHHLNEAAKDVYKKKKLTLSRLPQTWIHHTKGFLASKLKKR